MPSSGSLVRFTYRLFEIVFAASKQISLIFTVHSQTALYNLSDPDDDHRLVLLVGCNKFHSCTKEIALQLEEALLESTVS